MKKQTKKLTLNKKTISNLNSAEMGRVIGGGYTERGYGCGGSNNCSYTCSGATKAGNTCTGHNTCYTC